MIREGILWARSLSSVRGSEDVLLSAAKSRVLPTSCAERHMFGGGFREGEEHG